MILMPHNHPLSRYSTARFIQRPWEGEGDNERITPPNGWMSEPGGRHDEAISTPYPLTPERSEPVIRTTPRSRYKMPPSQSGVAHEIQQPQKRSKEPHPPSLEDAVLPVR